MGPGSVTVLDAGTYVPCANARPERRNSVQQDRPELHWLVPNSADGMHRRSHAADACGACMLLCAWYSAWLPGWWSRWTKQIKAAVGPKIPSLNCLDRSGKSRSSSIYCQKISYWELAATLPRCPLMPELAIGSLYSRYVRSGPLNDSDILSH